MSERKYISPEIKAFIHKRDDYTCQICSTKGIVCEDVIIKQNVACLKHYDGIYRGPGMNGWTWLVFHIDHIIPLYAGGDDSLENLRLTCPLCNLSRKRRKKYEMV